MKWLLCFFSLFILFSCNENTINEADMFKGKLNDKEYKAIELSVTHFNNYLKKCYPNLTYNESYQQFVQDFVKDQVKKGFYTIAYEDKINNNLLKNTNIFIKIKDANKNYSNPFKGEDENFDEYYPNLYILNSKSLFFKIIEKNATKNLKRYLSDVKKNKEYYSQNFPNTFLLNINQQDYKNSATKLIIIYNFYYNSEINLSNLFDNSKNR